MVYSTPINNIVSGNTIRSDGIYGVLLYNAPNNPVRPFTSLGRFLFKNKFGGQKTSFRNYQAGFDAGTSLPTRGAKVGHHAKAAHVVHVARTRHEKAAEAAKPHGSESQPLHRARPRVPALLESKAKHED